MYFTYDRALLERYPNIIGGVVSLQYATNSPTPQPLGALYEAQQAMSKAQMAQVSPSELASLAAWRAAFRAFGVDPTQYRSAAEALLRRLTKQGDIPNINALVDIGNLVSIRYGLPVAVFDTESIAGGLTVRFARGDERFSDLGGSESINPEQGEVVFVDENERVHARRWCWRQSAESAARETTRYALITVEAHHADGRKDVTAAVRDLLLLLGDYAGGTTQSAVLDAQTNRFSTE